MLGAIIAVIVGLTACGSSIPGDAVVQVGGSSISKATLDHWTPIEAVLASGYSHNLTQSVPKGVPVPPNYTACIASLGAALLPPGKDQSKPTAAQLRSRCRQRYETLRQHMLGILISFEWLLGESADQGVKVTDAEVEQQFEKFKHERFPTEATFQKFLAFTGMSVSDELFLTKKILLSTKIAQKLTGVEGLVAQQRQPRRLVRIAEEYTKKWTARTNCRAGYVVPGCKQYKGSLAPEI